MKILLNKRRVILIPVLILWSILLAVTAAILKQQSENMAKGLLSLRLIDCMEVLENAQKDMDTVSSVYKKLALAQCRSLAYALEQRRTAEIEPTKLKNVVEKLGIEEYFIINAQGIVEYSNVSDGVGYDMKSQPQSNEFMPAVTNPHFEYLQKPRRRGFDGELYQYVGVSRKDAPGIVQIAFHPKHYEDVYSVISLQRRMPSLRIGEHGFILLAQQKKIIAADNTSIIGCSMADIGVRNLTEEGEYFYADINGTKYLACSENFGELELIGFLPLDEVFRISRLCIYALIAVILAGFAELCIILYHFKVYPAISADTSEKRK